VVVCGTNLCQESGHSHWGFFLAHCIICSNVTFLHSTPCSHKVKEMCT